MNEIMKKSLWQLRIFQNRLRKTSVFRSTSFDRFVCRPIGVTIVVLATIVCATIMRSYSMFDLHFFVHFCARTSQIMSSVQNFAWSGFSKTAKVKSGRISRFILFLAWFVRLTMVGGHRICKLSWAGSPWIKRIYAKRSKSDLSTWDVIRTKSNFQKKYSAYFGVFTMRPSLLWVYH